MSEQQTFDNLVDPFLTWFHVYTTDHKTMKYRMELWRRPFADKRLAEITPLAIEAVIAERIASGISQSTCNRQVYALSRFFGWASKAGHHHGPNPCKDARRFPEGVGRTRFLTDEEAARLVEAANDYLRPIILLALNTGCRLSEGLRLLWSDCDMEGRTICFRREVTKNRRTRYVPMVPALHEVLSGLRRGRPDQHVFHHLERPIKSVRTAFEGALERAGLAGQGIVFHTLRHSYASKYVGTGGNIYRLKGYLGHGCISQTQRYSHLGSDFEEDASRFFGIPGTTKTNVIRMPLPQAVLEQEEQEKVISESPKRERVIGFAPRAEGRA